MPKLPEKKISEKTRELWDHVNDTKRHKYWTDDTYRENMKARARRRWTKLVSAPKDLRDCSQNLPHLQKLGSVNQVVGYGYQVITFNPYELGRAIGGYSEVCIRRWIKEGKFPAPVIKAYAPDKTGPSPLVYTEPQVRAFIEIMAKHQKYKRSLSQTDTETIKAFHAVIKG